MLSRMTPVEQAARELGDRFRKGYALLGESREAIAQRANHPVERVRDVVHGKIVKDQIHGLVSAHRRKDLEELIEALKVPSSEKAALLALAIVVTPNGYAEPKLAS
jgi:hypothetical protein